MGLYTCEKLAVNADSVAVLQLTSPSQSFLVVAVLAALACPHAIRAQEANSPPSPASLERVRVALKDRPSPLTIGPMVPIPPDERRFGILTFVPPNTRGEFVRIRVPVGALITGVAKSITASQHRRAENAARGEVAKALDEFRKAQAR